MKILKILKRILILFVIMILSLVIIMNTPIISINHQSSTEDYSNWMSETLDNNARAVNITMLGAHDAFSTDINIFSKVDTLSASDIMTGATGTLIKGFSVRQSVTQTATPEELLKNGVRYFDVRLSYDGEKWMTTHNYLSTDFADLVPEIISFLDDNPGEFLILDFQHIHGIDYTNDNDYDLFIDMLEETGLYDYSYLSSIKALMAVTYGDLTNNGTESKVIIVDKFEKNDKETFHYESSIRSNWANSDNFDDVITFLEDEKMSILVSSQTENFIVMQAVTTMSMSSTGILNSFKTWSLIERAEQFNTYLLEYEEFDMLVLTMPIIMVDYAHSAPFIDDVMTIILEANQ
jgi:hypothetical protein